MEAIIDEYRQREREISMEPKAEVIVILGPEGSPTPLDVRKDIEELFELFSVLEIELFRKAWNKIDFLNVKRTILSAKDLKPHEKAHFMNAAIHKELARACDNRTLIHAQDQIFKQIEFYRRMYISTLDEKDTQESIAAAEFILDLICAGDFQGVEQKISECFSLQKNELLSLFDETSIIMASS